MEKAYKVGRIWRVDFSQYVPIWKRLALQG